MAQHFTGTNPPLQCCIDGPLVLQFTADSAELAEKHVQAVIELCKIVQQQPGCLQFEVFRSTLRPEQYVVLEHWATQEALDERRRRMPPPGDPPPGITRTREIYVLAVS